VIARIFLAAFFFFSPISFSADARADHMPVQGPDGSIIYGDWGLYRPGHMAPVYEGPVVIGAPRFGTGYFFPTNRNDPNAYRSRAGEFGPSMPAEPYFRTWGAQSDPSVPSTEHAPFDPPEVIYAPREERRGKNLPPKKQ
jgi:hypothetical protein